MFRAAAIIALCLTITGKKSAAAEKQVQERTSPIAITFVPKEMATTPPPKQAIIDFGSVTSSPPLNFKLCGLPTAYYQSPLYQKSIANVSIAGHLRKMGALVDINHVDLPLLHLAAVSGDIRLAAELIKRGAHINTPDHYGRTPLHWATLACQYNFANFLLQGNATIDAIDCYHQTPLHNAVRLNDIDMVALLIARKANINAKNSWGCSPLHIAAGHGYETLVSFLLELGAETISVDGAELVPLEIVTRIDEQMHDVDGVYIMNDDCSFCSCKKKLSSPRNQSNLPLDD